MEFPQINSVPMDIPISQGYSNQIKICSALLRANTPIEIAKFAKQAQILLVTANNVQFIFQNFELSQPDENILDKYIKKTIVNYELVLNQTPTYKGQLGVFLEGIKDQIDEILELLKSALKQDGDEQVEIERSQQYIDMVKQNISREQTVHIENQKQICESKMKDFMI